MNKPQGIESSYALRARFCKELVFLSHYSNRLYIFDVPKDWVKDIKKRGIRGSKDNPGFFECLGEL